LSDKGLGNDPGTGINFENATLAQAPNQALHLEGKKNVGKNDLERKRLWREGKLPQMGKRRTPGRSRPISSVMLGLSQMTNQSTEKIEGLPSWKGRGDFVCSNQSSG